MTDFKPLSEMKYGIELINEAKAIKLELQDPRIKDEYAWELAARLEELLAEHDRRMGYHIAEHIKGTYFDDIECLENGCDGVLQLVDAYYAAEWTWRCNKCLHEKSMTPPGYDDGPEPPYEVY